MPRPRPSSGSHELQDNTPLLLNHDDLQSTNSDMQPTATGGSIPAKSFRAALETFDMFRSRPDLTSGIQKMEEWGKPNSGFAPIDTQVRYSLCNILGYHDPKCWPPSTTQGIDKVPITTFIQASAQDDFSRSQMEKKLKDLKKVKDDWDTYKRESICVYKRKHLRKIQFTDDPAHDELIEDFVSTIVKGIKRRFEEGRAGQEDQPELSSSLEHVSGVGSQVGEEINDCQDSISQYGGPDTSDALSIWSKA